MKKNEFHKDDIWQFTEFTQNIYFESMMWENAIASFRQKQNMRMLWVTQQLKLFDSQRSNHMLRKILLKFSHRISRFRICYLPLLSVMTEP